MLTALDIHQIVLIEALRLEFSADLSALTGETGAGKSILLDALGLALGARADAGLVRQGVEVATVSASFDVRDNHPARQILAANDLEHDGELILRRRLLADGGSRAFINDQPVSATLLRDVGQTLVEIHGQHDDRGLLQARGHRTLLDDFGGLEALLAIVSAAFEDWQAAKAAHHAALDAAAKHETDREWLSHALAEITKLAPEAGEEEALAVSRTAMQQGARLAGDLENVTALLGGSDGGLSKLRQAARWLDRMAPERDDLAAALAALDRALIEAGEADDLLASALRAMAFDPSRLEATETRLFDLRALARKHRTQVEALPALALHLADRAAAMAAGGDLITSTKTALTATELRYVADAMMLSAARQAAAQRLDAAVAGELAPLKLDAAKFRVAVDTSGGAWSAQGTDRVEFEVSTNPGAPFGPLLRIASGGELSRFVLALKVALAESGSAGTIIFDEIDRGVGGAVASAIGERLARLAKGTQLLVVTHSPQVAARATHQWRISKSSAGTVTRTDIALLDKATRQEEIARMLSGAQVTDEARAQAARLLGVAGAA